MRSTKYRARIKTACASLTYLLLPCAASADILFIDMNLGSAEVEAARQAAEARHEHLIVIPEISPADRTENRGVVTALEPLYHEREPLDHRRAAETLEYDRQVAHLSSAAPERLSRLYEAHLRRVAQIQALIQPIQARITPLEQRRAVIVGRNTFDAARIEAALTEIQQAVDQHAPGRSALTSLVVSGHSGGQARLWGDLLSAEISAFSLGDMLRAHPATAAPRSVFAWGCYSATIHSAVWWRTTFPSLCAILGYGGMAPSSLRESSVNTLRLALAHDEEYDVQRSVASAAHLLNALPAGGGETNLAGIINGCYINSTQPSLNRSIARVRPEDLCNVVSGDSHERWSPTSLLDHYNSRYQCYSLAQAGCPTVPSDPHNSDLRSFYDALQAYQHCTTGHPQYPTTDQVLALIFFQNVRRNFMAHYGAVLNGLARRLRQSDPMESALLENHIRALRLPDSAARRAATDLCTGLRRAAIVAPDAIPLSQACQYLVLDMRCVPATWITEMPEAGVPTASPNPACLGP